MALLPRKPVPSLEFETVTSRCKTSAGAIDFAISKNYPARGEARGIS